MTVERDIAGFAFPFAAGAAFIMWQPLPPSLLLLILACSSAVLIHPAHKSLSSTVLWSSIILLAFSCGALTGITHEITSAFNPDTFSGLLRHTHSFNVAMKSSIASIPFHDSNSNALISALITGDRSQLPQSVVQSFRASGASHILALSGLHLGIIYGILKALMAVWGHRILSRTAGSGIIILACGFYTLATGAGASIVRAFLFILLTEAATLAGRFRSTRTILWAALLIQLIINPSDLKSASFQLSYAAMAGIAYINPHIRKLWPEANAGIIGKGLKWIWNSAALSIACQITTSPIAWIYFESFPKYFLLTNLIAIPLTGLIIPASLAITALHSMGICPHILVTATEALINLLTGTLEVIGTL